MRQIRAVDEIQPREKLATFLFASIGDGVLESELRLVFGGAAGGEVVEEAAEGVSGGHSCDIDAFLVDWRRDWGEVCGGFLDDLMICMIDLALLMVFCACEEGGLVMF